MWWYFFRFFVEISFFNGTQHFSSLLDILWRFSSCLFHCNQLLLGQISNSYMSINSKKFQHFYYIIRTFIEFKDCWIATWVKSSVKEPTKIFFGHYFQINWFIASLPFWVFPCKHFSGNASKERSWKIGFKILKTSTGKKMCSLYSLISLL